LVGGVVGLRISVLSGSGVCSGRFFEALVVEGVADGVSCSTMLAQVFFAGWGIGVVVAGAESWSSLVRIWFKVSSCLVSLLSIARGIVEEVEAGTIGAASGM